MGEGPAVSELIASVRGNVDVAREAMRGAATEDSHHVVSDLMLEIKQAQDTLQKKATEMADSGRFDETNQIFETIDMVGQLEPEFARWSKGVPTGTDHIGANIHVDAAEPVQEEPVDKTKKKKKKKKRKDDSDGEGNLPIITGDNGGWEAFPMPPPTSSALWVDPQAATGSAAIGPPPVAAPRSMSADANNAAVVQPTPPGQPCSGVLSLGMKWETIGPLLGDPGSSEQVRRERLGEMIKEAIASECGITLERIRIKSVV